MVKITQKHLIEQLKELKDIKPRAEWVVLAKSQVFNGVPEERVITNPVRKVSIFEVIKSSVIHRKLAYSVATLAFIMVGVIGFAQYTMPGDLLFPVRKIAEQSEAALSGQTGIKQNVVTLNNRINDLAKAAKEGRKDNIPSAISEISTNASELAKTLKDNPVENTDTVKDIVASLKVLADVPGTDLSENQEVKNLYQAIVQNEIAYLEKTTLTEDQEASLANVKDLYEQGKYVEALEKIWDLSNNQANIDTDTNVIDATSTVDVEIINP